MNRPILVIVLMVLLIAGAWWRLSGQEEGQVRRSQIIMGTLVEITAFGPDTGKLDEVVSRAFSEMSRIEDLMSPHVETSDVTLLSKAVGQQKVSEETAEVIRLGLEIAQRSEGAFDLSMGRLIDIWDILNENPQVPEEARIRQAMDGLGPGGLSLEGRMVSKSNVDLQVDLGSIAKGYAVDRAWQLLKDGGVQNASVNAGGDLRLLGDRKGRPWRIGLVHPRKAGEVLAVLPSADEAVVTSGDYERYFEVDGQRYHHLIDPRTGYPANLCQAVTVVAPTADLADGLATAVFILGPEKGLKLMEEWDGVEGLIVDPDGKVLQTSGLNGRLEWP